MNNETGNLRKKRNIFFPAAFLILGVLLSLTPKHIAPVCPAMPDGSFMTCHWTGEAVTYLGVAIAVNFIDFAINIATSCQL